MVIGIAVFDHCSKSSILLQTKSDYKVFKSVVQSHKRKLCQRFELLHSVKDLLPIPKWEEKMETIHLCLAKYSFTSTNRQRHANGNDTNHLSTH
jgi:hypothetical protein